MLTSCRGHYDPVIAVRPSPAALRAGDLLLLLSREPGRSLTVSELARALDVPRPTCDTLLLALAERGLVRRDSDRRYSLGPACLVIGAAARAANPVLRAAADEAEALASARGAVTAVMVLDRDHFRIAAAFDFAPALAFRAKVGEAYPLLPPFGAPVVAWGSEAEVREWLGRAEHPLTPGEERDLRATLGAIRRRGYSVTVVAGPARVEATRRLADDTAGPAAERARAAAVRRLAGSEEVVDDLAPDDLVRLARVAAPVFDPAGRAAAAITLLGPPFEIPGREVADLGTAVAAAAHRATAAITAF